MGKSQTFLRHSGIKPTGERVIYWDTNKDHIRYGNKRNATPYQTAGAFFQALLKCAASGRGFRIAYTGSNDLELYEDVCAAVWDILDGRHLTHFVTEEYGAACADSGPINKHRYPYHKLMWEQSRKYGGILHGTSQRPQTISTDSVENAGIIWAGNMGRLAAKHCAADMDISPDDLKALEAGQFYYWRVGKDAKKVQSFIPLDTGDDEKEPDFTVIE